MGWRCVYEDLSEFDSITHKIDDLPVDGVQGIVADGKPLTGFDSYGILPDGTVVVARVGQDISASYPTAKVLNTKTISTRQFHQVEKKMGLWSPLNKEPFQGWEKDIVGIRVWTSNKVLDTKGLTESEWVAWYAKLPDDIQETTLYENWFTSNGEQYRQFVGGFSTNYFVETPYGPAIAGTEEDPSVVLARYPNAIVRLGKLIPDTQYKRIEELQLLATVF